MKKLSDVYELSNGEIVKGKANAENKQRELDQSKALKSLVIKEVIYSEYQDTVLDFIKSHGKQLKEILAMVD